MRRNDAYLQFVRRFAVEFVGKPETTVSRMSGLGFRDLQPDFFEGVQQGHSQFDVPRDQVYEDLVEACERQQRSWRGRAKFWIVRNLRRVVLLLRLLLVLWIIFPLTSRRMRRRDVRLVPPEPQPMAGDSGPQQGAPQASIVVLSFNRLAYLKNTLEALRETTDSARYELIAVDNGSRDGSAEFLQDEHQQGRVSKLVLLDENLGTSAGYNHGFAVADERSEYLMKLDSDIQILTAGWLAEVSEFLSANKQVGFVALTQVNHPLLRLLPSLRVDGRDVMKFAEWPSGGAMVIPKRVRRELGCFIEEGPMKYAPDDIDYGIRALRRGYEVFFLRNVLVYHQTDLDRSDYREYHLSKPFGPSSQLALQLAREYDRGLRSLEIHYPKYQGQRASE